MKALVLKSKGVWPLAEQIELERSTELVYPEMIYSALNHRDVWIVMGQYPGIRYPLILGSDGLGYYQGKRIIINPSIQWGKNQNFQSSTYHILGLPLNGTFAQLTGVPVENIFKAPDHLTDEEGAALPLAGLTAYRALFVKARPSPGEKVFITGIGGGVALIAMQMAIAAGLTVLVSSGSEQKLKKAKEMGASGGVNYKDPDWIRRLAELEPGGFDIVIDGTGGAGVSEIISVCKPGARIVIYGGTAGKIPAFNPQQIFWKQIQILGTTMGSDEDFSQMLNFVSKHKIRPVVDTVFSFSQAEKAFERMNSAEQFGKIVFDNQK